MKVIQYYDRMSWRVALWVETGRKYEKIIPMKHPLVVRKVAPEQLNNHIALTLAGEEYPVERALDLFRQFAKTRSQELSQEVKKILEVDDELVHEESDTSG